MVGWRSFVCSERDAATSTLSGGVLNVAARHGVGATCYGWSIRDYACVGWMRKRSICDSFGSFTLSANRRNLSNEIIIHVMSSCHHFKP